MFLSIRTAAGRFAAATVAAVAAALISCAGAPPAAAPAPEKTAPAWTAETPASDAKYTYFVGYGEGAGPVPATDAATATLVAEILRYIGATISAESTATARSTLDTFQADLVQTVKQTSTSRVAGFQVMDKYVAEGKAGATVYILGRYATTDLNAEKRRIAGLFQEKVDATAVPEAEGDDLIWDGEVVAAARKFIQAAVAASGSDLENAQIKLERNLSKAKSALAGVTLEKLNDRLETAPFVPFTVPFKAVVKSGGRPLAGVPILVGYQARLASGKTATRTATALSDASGVVSFDHPAPEFVGKAVLTMRLDLAADTAPLAAVGGRAAPLVAGLEDEIAAKRLSFAYSVVSAARSIPTAVWLVDADADGGRPAGAASAALLQVLAKNGFAAFDAAQPAAFATGDDAAVLAAARKALAGKARRLAWGTTRVVSVRDDSGQKVATVAAEIKAADLETGRILYSSAKQVPAVGSTEREAADAARRTLGLALGEDLAAQLP